MSGGPGADEAEFVSYERWGVDFFVEAVSRDRILGAVNTLAGQPIDFGPMGVGPGRIAKVRAYGEIGAATAERLDAAQRTFRVERPVDLTFELDLQVETPTFHAQLLVPLILTARALPGVRVYVEITPPRGSEVQVQVQADGLRASIMQRVANIEGELRRFVARYVARELTKPHVEAARMIDVAAAIDRAWAAMAPGSPRRAVAEDLNEALESEIRENEETFLEM
jgi:hypothetical protein